MRSGFILINRRNSQARQACSTEGGQEREDRLFRPIANNYIDRGVCQKCLYPQPKNSSCAMAIGHQTQLPAGAMSVKPLGSEYLHGSVCLFNPSTSGRPFSAIHQKIHFFLSYVTSTWYYSIWSVRAVAFVTLSRYKTVLTELIVVGVN